MNIIFLDIDGVLQPLDSEERFNFKLDELRKNFAETIDPKYMGLDAYDIGAVYYDWDKNSVEYLKKLCEEFDSQIVLISDWRNYNPYPRMKLLFKIHHLDIFYRENAEYKGKNRVEDVKVFLQNHPEIKKFVIFDDYYTDGFSGNFPNNFIHCEEVIDNELYQKARKIFLT